MASGYRRQRATLVHPRCITPEDLLTFIELRGFTTGWKQMGLVDQDLGALQMCIMASPTGAPVIPGTGGLRKVRFAPSKWGTGKRGAARVCYAYYEEYAVVLLAAAYSKSRKDDLSREEMTTISGLLARFGKNLEARGRGRETT